MKLMKYIASAGHSSRIMILLSICTDELMSSPKTIIFFPNLPFTNKSSEGEPNSMS